MIKSIGWSLIILGLTFMVMKLVIDAAGFGD